MNKRLLNRILPHGTELLRRLALAEVLGPPPSGSARHEQMKGGPRSPGPPVAPGPRVGPQTPPGPGRGPSDRSAPPLPEREE